MAGLICLYSLYCLVAVTLYQLYKEPLTKKSDELWALIVIVGLGFMRVTFFNPSFSNFIPICRFVREFTSHQVDSASLLSFLLVDRLHPEITFIAWTRLLTFFNKNYFSGNLYFLMAVNNILYAISLYVGYATARRFFKNSKVALMYVLILGLLPTFTLVWTSYSESNLSVFLQSLMLFHLIGFSDSRKYSHLIGLVLSIGLLVFTRTENLLIVMFVGAFFLMGKLVISRRHKIYGISVGVALILLVIANPAFIQQLRDMLSKNFERNLLMNAVYLVLIVVMPYYWLGVYLLRQGFSHESSKVFLIWIFAYSFFYLIRINYLEDPLNAARYFVNVAIPLAFMMTIGWQRISLLNLRKSFWIGLITISGLCSNLWALKNWGHEGYLTNQSMKAVNTFLSRSSAFRDFSYLRNASPQNIRGFECEQENLLFVAFISSPESQIREIEGGEYRSGSFYFNFDRAFDGHLFIEEKGAFNDVKQSRFDMGRVRFELLKTVSMVKNHELEKHPYFSLNPALKDYFVQVLKLTK